MFQMLFNFLEYFVRMRFFFQEYFVQSFRRHKILQHIMAGAGDQFGYIDNIFFFKL